MSVADLTHAFGINPRAFMLLSATSSGCIPASCSATARPGPFPSMPCCETTSRWRRRSSPYCRRRLAAMWPIRPPPAAGAGGYIVRMLMPGWRQANGMLRQEPKSSSISPAIARKDALRVTDYMDTLMLGLSAKAREGDSLPRLLRPCGWQAWRWSASCQPESSDGLSARHLDPLGGYPAVIVA